MDREVVVSDGGGIVVVGGVVDDFYDEFKSGWQECVITSYGDRFNAEGWFDIIRRVGNFQKPFLRNGKNQLVRYLL